MPSVSSKTVPALERSLKVIEILANSRGGQTLSQVVRALDIPKSSTHRLLLTLVLQGYLSRNDRTGRYSFGLKLFNTSNKGLSRTSLGEQARPALYCLMQGTGLTVHMAILDQDQALLIEKVDGVTRLGGFVGRGISLHCTGIGKALLAYLPSENIEHVIGNGLMRYNDNSIVSGKKLKDELDRIRHLGYSVCDEEEIIGLRCVGAPILDSNGGVIASISLAGSTEQIHAANICRLGALVRASAADLSRQLEITIES